MSLIRAILTRAKNDWEWIDNVPAFKSLPEPSEIVRWLTEDEESRLMQKLPEHLKALAKFSLATGLRESNVTGLRWDQLDIQRRCA